MSAEVVIIEPLDERVLPINFRAVLPNHLDCTSPRSAGQCRLRLLLWRLPLHVEGIGPAVRVILSTAVAGSALKAVLICSAVRACAHAIVGIVWRIIRSIRIL